MHQGCSSTVMRGTELEQVTYRRKVFVSGWNIKLKVISSSQSFAKAKTQTAAWSLKTLLDGKHKSHSFALFRTGVWRIEACFTTSDTQLLNISVRQQKKKRDLDIWVIS